MTGPQKRKNPCGTIHIKTWVEEDATSGFMTELRAYRGRQDRPDVAVYTVYETEDSRDIVVNTDEPLAVRDLVGERLKSVQRPDHRRCWGRWAFDAPQDEVLRVVFEAIDAVKELPGRTRAELWEELQMRLS